MILALTLFRASSTTVVYYGMRAVWLALVGFEGMLRFTSKEFMTMSAYSLLPQQTRLTKGTALFGEECAPFNYSKEVLAENCYPLTLRWTAA